MTTEGEGPETAPFHEDRLDELAESFVERMRRGEAPEIEDYARDHPDLAERIRKIFPTLRTLEKAAAVDPSEPSASAGGRPLGMPPLPEKIGEYRIVRELGRGGMGIVYEAIQESLGRRVALKLLPSWARLDARRLARFHEEARAAAALQHPNIVQVHGVGEEGGIPYYIMQFVEGPGLDRVLADLRRHSAGFARNPSRAVRRAALFFCGGGRPSPASAAATAASPSSPPDGRRKTFWALTRREESCFSIKNLYVSGSEGSREPGEAGGTSADRAAGEPETGSATGTTLLAPTPTAYFENAVRLMIQAAEALAYAHEQGVIHRDIKPSNILLDRSGRAWITDFGLAKVGKGEDITRSGEVLGTPRYMAPERLRGWSDPRSDVYGLGITLYEVLVLRPAFEDSEPSDLFRRIAEDEPARPRKVDPRIPRDLETVVLKAIAREPAERYQSAADLAEDLRRFLRGEPVRAQPTSVWRRSAKWARRRPAAAALLAVIVLAAGTIFGLTLQSRASLRAENEKARANLLDALGAVKSMLVRFGSEDLAIWPQGAILRRNLIEEAKGFHRRFLERSPDDPKVSLEAALVQRRMAEIQAQAGLLLEARDSYGRALEILEPASRRTDAADIRKELESILSQKRFLDEGGRPASGARVSRYFIARGTNVVDARGADIDGDGRMELLAACRDPRNVIVLRAGKPREYSAAARFQAGVGPTRIIACNFDGNDRPDLAVVSTWKDGVALSFLLGGRDGTFDRPVPCPIPNFPFGTVAGDLDGDGRDEVASLGHVLQVVDRTDEGEIRLWPEIKVPDLGNSLAAGDFDGDGHRDLAAGCFPKQRGLLWLWWGDGKGGTSGTSELPCRPAPLATIPGDLDGDGRLDLAMYDGTTSRFAVVRNQGARSFAVGEGLPLPKCGFPLNAADLDGDGDLDLALGEQTEGRITILRNDGKGTFLPGRALLSGGWAFGGWAGDVDGDGSVDLVIANGQTDDVAVMYDLREHLAGKDLEDAGAWGGKGHGVPEEDLLREASGDLVVQFSAGRGTYPLAVAAGDLDGDGRPELVTGDMAARAVSVLRAREAREYARVAFLPVGLQPMGMAIAEVDGRKGPDLVLFGPGEAKVAILGNRGDGTFGAPAFAPLPEGMRAMAAADLDGDGRAEVAIAGDRIAVLRVDEDGKPVLGPPVGLERGALHMESGDLDGDRRQDLALCSYSAAGNGAVLIRWGDGKCGMEAATEIELTFLPDGITAADLDGDGDPDFALNDTLPRMTVAWNEGGRKFRVGEFVPLPAPLVTAAAGDLDGDGTADLAYVNGGGGIVYILLGHRSGKLSLGRPLFPGGEAYLGWAGDLDGDGQADLAIANGRWDGIGICFRMSEHLRGSKGGEGRK